METRGMTESELKGTGNLFVRLFPLWEILAIFVLFALYGYWPVPDVNEQYYVGKAIHFWNPGWFAADPFLETPDSHWFFCAVFGFFSLFLKPIALVWLGRISIWFLTAWGWRSLSWTLIPRRGVAVLTAAGFLFYLENFHLAGEWIAGGVEGKGFAFPFLFWGLAFWLRREYFKAYLFMGVASAFHVLVGGWGVLASLGAMGCVGFYEHFILREKKISSNDSNKERKRLLGGLLVGGLIALLGLVPALRLDGGVSSEIQRQAHEIYVYERLAHHLLPSSLPWTFLTRFFLMAAVGLLFCRFSGKGLACFQGNGESSEAEGIDRWRQWNSFVGIALLIAGIGLILDFGSTFCAQAGWIADRKIAAGLLRFYWFRLSDWVVPAGVSLGGCAFLLSGLGGFFNEKKTNPYDFSKNEFSLGGLIGTFLGGVFLFILCKRIFLAIVVSGAKAATVNPHWPVLPKPVDAVSFMTALVLWGILIKMFYGIKNRRAKKEANQDKKASEEKNGTFSIRSGLLGWGLTAAILAPGFGLAQTAALKSGNLIPRSNPPKASISRGWMDVCHWAERETPESAVFLVPRGYDSWKWNSHRPDVGNWKEIPQDAASMVKWFRKMEDLYTPLSKGKEAKGKDRWNQPLIAILLNKGEKRILKQSERYGFDYIVAEQPPYNLAAMPKAQERFDDYVKKYAVYQNGHFIVFRLPSGLEKSSKEGKITSENSSGAE